MFPFIPSLLLLLLLAAPALLTPSTSQELQVRGQRAPRDTKQDSVKVVISEGFVTQGDSSDASQEGKEINLVPGSPLVLTHKIKLVPSGSGSGSRFCGCETDFAALRERLERLEREVSSLREKCGGAEGGCCTSKESKGAGCSIKPETDECPNECSDQGRCVDGKCVCFSGFSGPDCSESDCPGNCNNHGRCVNGQCVCDPGFTGADCSPRSCPDNCNNHGRCVNGRCVCDVGFTGPSCSDESCPGGCNSRGRCVNGECVCSPGFTGPDCSKRTCPDNCNDRGRCVNGKCVCDSGFTGADCSEKSCPGNCNNRGRCVNGQCVCNPGFTGPDCFIRACPDNCSNRGRCVNGKCVCDNGFTGADCSEASCPGNCNSRGRCVNGECVCHDGFGGPDCSERTCPNDCSDHGRCVNGRCVCDGGFTGDDCSEASCPENCNSRGRCVNGRCICDDGFAGVDCSGKACPNNCSNRGKCMNGKCICDVGFTGPGCAAKSCPGNCNNKGRCVKGRCVCRRGFTGPDCSQCEEGKTGPNCDTVMSGVSQLSARDVTETAVTLLWTPPGVQYDTYHITFTSQKESDQQISVQVEGSLTSFTQTGLAAGQDYTVSITGEIDGRKGAETSAKFTTLISGPTNLQVVKTTSTSAVVQWEQSQGEIDRYRLTVTPSGGAGRSQEMTIPAGQDSAHLQQLEAGRLYDIILMAERGTSRSEPATTQVTPGMAIPRVTTAPLTLAPGQDVGDRHQDFNPSAEVQVFDQQGRREDGSEAVRVRGIDGPNKDSTTSVTARTKPLVSGKMGKNGTRPKDSERPALYRRPNASGPFRFNTTRAVPERRKFGPGPLKKPPVGQKKKVPTVPNKTKPGVPTIRDRTLTMRDPSVDAPSTERRDNKNPAIMSGTDSDANRLSSFEEPTAAVGSKEQPDVGTAGQGNDTAPVSSEPTGTVQSQEKKCMNKVKVTHIRLPHWGRGSGCKGDGTVLVGKTLGSDRGSSETNDLKTSSAETDRDHSPDSLHQLLADTFDSLNTTTFSVHLSEPSNFSFNEETARKQILSGLKPLSPSSSWSSSSTSQSSSQSSPSSTSPSLASSSSTAPSSPSHSSSLPSSPSSLAPLSSLILLVTSPSSLPSPPSSLPLLSPSPPSASLSSSDKSGSVGSNELDDITSPEDRKLPPSGKGGVPLFHRTPAKHGYIRRLHQNFGLFQNKTHLKLRVPHHPRLNLTPRREPETRHTSTNELSFSPSSSVSEEPSTVVVNVPVRDSSGLKPLSPSSSSSTTQSSSQSSSSLASPSLASSSSTAAPLPSHSSAEPSSSLPTSSSSLASLSLAPSSSIADSSSSLTSLVSSPSSLPSSLPSLSPSPPSASLPSSDKSGSVGGNELDVDNSKSATEVPSPDDQKQPPPGKGDIHVFHRTPAKQGHIRRMRPNFGSFQNKTRLNWRVPHGSTPHLNLIPRRDPEIRHRSTSELSSSLSSSASEEPSSVEVNAPVIGDKDGATTPVSSGVEQNQKKMPTERGRIPVRRRLPPKGGYKRRPNFGPRQNWTRPNLRLLPPPSQPLNPASETRREQISPTELPATSSSKEIYPAEGTGPIGEENVDRVGPKMSSTSMSAEFNQTLRGSEVPSSHRPTTRFGYFRRPQLYRGRFPNKTHSNLRPPQHPMHQPFPARKLNEGITFGAQVRQLDKDSTPEIPGNQSGGQDSPISVQGVQIRQSGEQDTAEVIPSPQMNGHDTIIRPQINKVEGGDNYPTQTTKSGEETSTPDSNLVSDTHKERDNTGKATSRGKPTVKQISSDSSHESSRPVTPPKRQPPTTTTLTAPHPPQMRRYNSGSKMREDKTNSTTKVLFVNKPKQSINSVDSKPPTGSDVPSSGVTREPLDHVGVTNRTSDGFTLIWDSPEEKYKNFVVTSKEVGKVEGLKQKKDSEKESGDEEEEAKHQPTKEAENRGSEDKNRVPESVSTQGPQIQSSTKAKPVTGSDRTFKKVLPGSARSFQFENLPPQTEYTVTLLGKGRGLLSRLHKLVISTGPEPPTDIVFSEVTENSLTVSWTKPKTSIGGFKVTYTHAEEGEPVSVSVDSDDSAVSLSRLSPGSSYEVSVLSVLGLDESDPIKDFVMTLPDPPTHLRALNVTDTKALLLWRPALAAVDKYAIVYGSGTDSELRVTVSGNAAEQQLSGLEGSTTYTVTITSQLGGVESSTASTSFTTGGSGSDGDGPRDLQANNVTPRSALLSWKPPSNPVSSYRLTYQTKGQEMREVIVDASVTEYSLTRLHSGSEYTVQLQAEAGGRYTDAISADFTTGTLRFPFPTDCSQELLNGIRTSGEVEIFPQGKLGPPMMVYCDMETDGGGWTVFQRRKDGSVDFFRGWKDYTKGFGSLSGEFWLGLESLYNLTAMTKMSLRVDLRDKDEAVFAKYSTFELLKRNYKLNVGGYSGTAGDSLSYHNQRIFSTKDRDLAPFITRCAMSYRGGWWYKNCHEANLNGLYGTNDNHQGVIWTTWRGKQFSIPFTEMKMRPAAFSPPTRG